MREFGEVAVPTAKAHPVLATVLWIGIGMILQQLPRGKDSGTVIALSYSRFRRCCSRTNLRLDEDDLRHLDVDGAL